jgi:CheY-like chemotaxis protein
MSPLRRPRILIVEDEAKVRTQFERALSRIGEVEVAERVDEVFYQLLTGVDLILLDIALEGEKVYEWQRAGVKILERIKQLRLPFRDIPIIVVTGLIEPAVEEKCRELGIVEFLRKPVSLQVLRRKVQTALEKQRQQEQRIRIFISSTMRDLKAERRVVRDAISDLGPKYDPLLAEDCRAHTKSPREICQQAARVCDIFILLIGKRYGAPLVKGNISPTEDEYNTARESGKRILVFVKEVPDREPLAEAFLAKVSDFKHGHWIKNFSDLHQLRFEVQEAMQEQAVSMRGREGTSIGRDDRTEGNIGHR